VSRLTDRLYELEHKLDKDEGFLSRRLILREFGEAVAADARKEGYQDGMRDALDAGYAEKEAARREDNERGAFDGAPGHG
jgi:hypothetical protein